MKPEVIEKHIDNLIRDRIQKGDDIEKIIDFLSEYSSKFIKRKTNYIDVSKRYLLNNWNLINIKKKYSTYIVICCKQRMIDLNWIKNSEIEIERSKIVDIIQFKENLKIKLL